MGIKLYFLGDSYQIMGDRKMKALLLTALGGAAANKKSPAEAGLE